MRARFDGVASSPSHMSVGIASPLPATPETLMLNSVPKRGTRRRRSSRRGISFDAGFIGQVEHREGCRPVEPDASRGARPERRRLARAKFAGVTAGTNRAFYPMEIPSERGRQGNTFFARRRTVRSEAGE